jgi:hypothetical protein
VSPSLGSDEAFLRALRGSEEEELPEPAQSENERVSSRTNSRGGTETAPQPDRRVSPRRRRNYREDVTETLETPVVSKAPVENETFARPLITREQPGVRRRTGRTRLPMRRVHRTVKHVSVWSVLKMSLFYYMIALLLWLAFVVIIFQLISALQTFETVEAIAKSFQFDALTRIDIPIGAVVRWALLLGIIGVVIGTLVNTLLTFLYNVGSDLVGGIEITFVDREES